MSTLEDDLENFLANVLHARALDKARKVCLQEDIYRLGTLENLRAANQLKNVFTMGTALSIREGLSGQSCLVLVTGVPGVHVSPKSSFYMFSSAAMPPPAGQYPTVCPPHLQQHPDHVMDIGARLFVDVVPKVLLRPLACKMWADVFGSPWQDGVHCGRALLYGRLDQSGFLDDRLEFQEGNAKVTVLGWDVREFVRDMANPALSAKKRNPRPCVTKRLPMQVELPDGTWTELLLHPDSKHQQYNRVNAARVPVATFHGITPEQTTLLAILAAVDPPRDAEWRALHARRATSLAIGIVGGKPSPAQIQEMKLLTRAWKAFVDSLASDQKRAVEDDQNRVAAAARAAKKKAKKEHSFLTLKQSFRLDGSAVAGTKYKLRVRAHPMGLYVRHAGDGSAIQGTEAQECILEGQMSQWDLTTLMWMLLNSGHDGRAADTEPRGIADAPATATPALRALHARLRKLLEQKPNGLRPQRNVLFGHKDKWQVWLWLWVWVLVWV